MLDTRRQFRVLYRDFLARTVDLELVSAGGEIQKLLAQFAALLAAFSFCIGLRGQLQRMRTVPSKLLRLFTHTTP